MPTLLSRRRVPFPHLLSVSVLLGRLVEPAGEVAARGIETLPPTLYHAAENLMGNDVMGEAFGMTPDGPYRDYFVQVKKDEFLDHHHEVTSAEVSKYLTMF